MTAQVETKTVDSDEAGMRLDRWFKSHFPDIAFGHLQKLLRSGQVRVDGGRAKTNTRLDIGQTVRIPPLSTRGAEATADDAEDHEEEMPRSGERPPVAAAPSRGTTGTVGAAKKEAARPAHLKSDEAEIRGMVLYEDDALMVLNKPVGLAVQGGSGLTKHLDGMLEALRDSKDRKPRLVHRLDRETSGVLVVAKTRAAAAALAGSFKHRSARKVYWSLVAGVPKPKQGKVSTWLAKDIEAGEGMMIAKHGADDASHAVSLYSVIETAAQQLAWLSMRPVTGRTHQLRAHAAHIGHPIVGDPLYFEKKDWVLPGGIQNRLHLLARRLVLPHPDGGQIDVTAPLPPHMLQSWNLLGLDVSAGANTEPEEE